MEPGRKLWNVSDCGGQCRIAGESGAMSGNVGMLCNVADICGTRRKVVDSVGICWNVLKCGAQWWNVTESGGIWRRAVKCFVMWRIIVERGGEWWNVLKYLESSRLVGLPCLWCLNQCFIALSINEYLSNNLECLVASSTRGRKDGQAKYHQLTPHFRKTFIIQKNVLNVHVE